MIISKTKSQWTEDNTILANGDYGIESENGHYKVGDGVRAWNITPYSSMAGGLLASLTTRAIDGLNSKQDLLVSATNIKTINGSSVLGNGNLVVGGEDPTKQPLDSDLTAIAGINSTLSGVISSDGTGWIHKTYVALKTALGLVKADVGLSNVDNTSDANKPVSNATQTALDGKQASGTYATGTGSATGTNTGDNATNTQYSGLTTSKQDTLVSATNIKTINGVSILGGGDLPVSASDQDISPSVSRTIATGKTVVIGSKYVITGALNLTIQGNSILRIL